MTTINGPMGGEVFSIESGSANMYRDREQRAKLERAANEKFVRDKYPNVLFGRLNDNGFTVWLPGGQHLAWSMNEAKAWENAARKVRKSGTIRNCSLCGQQMAPFGVHGDRKLFHAADCLYAKGDK